MLELSEKLQLKKEQVEQKVAEGKSDEICAMYNMLLDVKRREQGTWKITIKLQRKRELRIFIGVARATLSFPSGKS